MCVHCRVQITKQAHPKDMVEGKRKHELIIRHIMMKKELLQNKTNKKKLSKAK